MITDKFSATEENIKRLEEALEYERSKFFNLREKQLSPVGSIWGQTLVGETSIQTQEEVERLANMRIKQVKQLRKDLDQCLQGIKELSRTEATFLSQTKVKESIMWLGMELKEIKGDKSFYKNSYDPTSTVIEDAADRLKL